MPAGRPFKKIDEDLLKKLAHIHCTMDEMASILGCSVDTLERNYAGMIKEAKDGGKMSLRRQLFQMALNGNLGAAVWLSKQHLGMSEKIENKNDVQIALKDLTKKEDKELLAEIIELQKIDYKPK